MRRLLEQYVPPVYRFSLRLTGGDANAAEDLTQETMLRACRHQGKMRNAATARPWLFKITANLWRDQQRRAKVREAFKAASAPGSTTYTIQPDRTVLEREELARALRALNELPGRQREVLYLSACEGLSISQIANVLETNADATKASLYKARQRIRQQLEHLRV